LLQTDLLACASWLRDAPPQVRWRGEVFRRLARIAFSSGLPENLRLRALAGLVASSDPSILPLFKQALANADPFSRRIAVLGLGALEDSSVVAQIAALFEDPYLDVRWAAALALAAIASDPAIDALARGMLAGDDNLKQACAQALARNAERGHDLLRDAIIHEDLAVRRAAVYGLSATRANWATAILEKIQVDEPQWFVRNAAVEALAQAKQTVSHAPRPYQPPEAQGWLIAWAAGQGVGVPPGQGAVEVLGRALREGDEPTRRAAAQSLGRLGGKRATEELLRAIRQPPSPLVQDEAFRALAHIAAASEERFLVPSRN
jgi:HEAT repeat protein